MQKDNLLEIKNKIEQYCKENNIAIFYGDFEAPHMPSVEWEVSDLSDWEGYLDVLKQLNGKVLSLETTTNSLEEDDTIRGYCSSLEGEDKRLFKKALDTITKAKGHIATLSLCYFEGGVRYFFELEAEWKNDHDQVLEAYEDHASANEDNENEDEDSISEQTANSIARMIIEEKNFINAKPRDRFDIAKEILIERKDELGLKGMDFLILPGEQKDYLKRKYSQNWIKKSRKK